MVICLSFWPLWLLFADSRMRDEREGREATVVMSVGQSWHAMMSKCCFRLFSRWTAMSANCNYFLLVPASRRRSEGRKEGMQFSMMCLHAPSRFVGERCLRRFLGGSGEGGGQEEREKKGKRGVHRGVYGRGWNVFVVRYFLSLVSTFPDVLTPYFIVIFFNNNHVRPSAVVFLTGSGSGG